MARKHAVAPAPAIDDDDVGLGETTLSDPEPRRHEILGIVVLSLTVLVALSIASYDARGGDDWIGVLGVWIAGVLASAFGIAAWVVSATNVWSVQAMAEYLGLRADRVIGMRTRVEDGVITSELELPAPATWGKVLAIQRYIHPTQPPALVAGDNITDLPMLEYSADTRLVIDRGVKALRDVARKRQAAGERWLIQPQFHVE